MTTTHVQSWRTRVALLLAGQTLSLIGSSVVQYAIVWHLVMRTDSGAVMTVTTLCAALPQAIVSLFGGVWADRWNRKALIMLPDAIIALATIALALSIANGGEALALFFVILMIRSAGGGVQAPAVQSFIPDITPEEKLLRVNSINGTIQSVNMIAAPAIAAVLINVMPLWTILYVDVTTAVVGIAFVALIRVRGAGRTRPDEAPSAFAEMRAGLRYAWRYPRIRSVLVSYALVCFVNIAPMNLTLLLMNRGFQGGLDLGFTVLETASDKLAANEMAWSVGMVVGGALLATVGAKLFHDNMALLAAAFFGMGIGTVALGLAPTLLVYLLVDFLIGVSTAIGTSPTYTLLQQETESDMQGRVFGLLTTFSGFGTPLGMLVFGPLADVVDVRAIFIVGGVLTIPFGVWLLRVDKRWAREVR
ncbi:MFS transporter [Bifidobacterium criceti]|uniref:Major facilitator superfamily protein n=1 Tax=Bifidobacterium criceti TaxID=1960969 RepID=A0A2A2EFE7_9BIFI|nr:MFS transporter [Bifidobacterium criceti]PAU67929.1 major facilitator superfamily protein [Bifidobacterium criceti]